MRAHKAAWTHEQHLETPQNGKMLSTLSPPMFRAFAQSSCGLYGILRGNDEGAVDLLQNPFFDNHLTKVLLCRGSRTVCDLGAPKLQM